MSNHLQLIIPQLFHTPQGNPLLDFSALMGNSDSSELLSVEDYILVGSERQAVEVHHRDREHNFWITRFYGPGDTVRIESLNAEFLMNEIYERIRFKQ